MASKAERLAAMCEWFKQDRVAFAQEVLGLELYPWQIEVLNNLFPERRMTKWTQVELRTIKHIDRVHGIALFGPKWLDVPYGTTIELVTLKGAVRFDFDTHSVEVILNDPSGMNSRVKIALSALKAQTVFPGSDEEKALQMAASIVGPVPNERADKAEAAFKIEHDRLREEVCLNAQIQQTLRNDIRHERELRIDVEAKLAMRYSEVKELRADLTAASRRNSDLERLVGPSAARDMIVNENRASICRKIAEALGCKRAESTGDYRRDEIEAAFDAHIKAYDQVRIDLADMTTRNSEQQRVLTNLCTLLRLSPDSDGHFNIDQLAPIIRRIVSDCEMLRELKTAAPRRLVIATNEFPLPAKLAIVSQKSDGDTEYVTVDATLPRHSERFSGQSYSQDKLYRAAHAACGHGEYPGHLVKAIETAIGNALHAGKEEGAAGAKQRVAQQVGKLVRTVVSVGEFVGVVERANNLDGPENLVERRIGERRDPLQRGDRHDPSMPRRRNTVDRRKQP